MRKLRSYALIFICLCCVAVGQTSQSGTSEPAQPKVTQQAPLPPSAEKAPAPEHKITEAEAQELFQSVDQILRFASQDTLLPIKKPVKKTMVSREQVEQYIGDKFKDDVDRIRFERSELVLKKFGLLPRTFDLHSFLIKLLGEQVAGYYDEKTKTMNLLNWVELDMQKPIMAHELTHALQDQSFNLEKMSKQDEAVERRGPKDPNALINIDELSTARSAVMEGQAMIVFADYMLKPMGRSVQDSPKILDMMQAEAEKDDSSKLFESAPILLKEELMFPYGPGMKFIRDLLLAGGKKLAFTGVLQRMPRTSREILQPQEYLAGHVVPPLLLPNLDFLKKDYEPFDAGAIGQLDVSILLKQYAEDSVAQHLSPEWRGGSYYAVGRRDAKPPDSNSTAHIGLIYISKWSSADFAVEFAKVYASALPSRYSGLQRTQAEGNEQGRQSYASADGPIYIQQTGELVIIVESFDKATADKMIAAVLAKEGKTQQAAK